MNKPESVTAGRINRTGLGKLAGITSEVIVLEEVEDGSADFQSADVVVESQAREPELPMPMDTIITIAPQEKPIVRDLVDKEINDLPHANGHLKRSERRRMERMATIGRV
jgi:hypothetical protein